GSFDRPYSVASDGTIDLERISNRGTLRYTPNRGYFIEEKRPLLQAKTQKDTFLITSVNTGRKENALTLYTSAYGPSTKTNDFGYEVTVANGKVVSGQKGNSKIGENQYVLSGHGESRDALRKLKVGTPITIQNRPELAQVSTTGGAALQAGTMVLKNGNYVGADGTHNKARSFIGTTKDHNLVVLTVDKAGLQSVGVTQQEGAKLLSKLGVVDGAELSNQGSVDLVVNDTYVHKATPNPTTYEDIVIIK
ncbi:MAG: phosphodiester glycosidase family protein, partial [Veillonella sp.]|nr:phosphodiester glycosidase family protein [Veillonella sp.]